MIDLKSIVIKDEKDEDGYYKTSIETKDGQPIGNVFSVKYYIDAKSMVGKAELELMNPEAYLEAEDVSYCMYDPNDGATKKVSKIIFDDNSELNME